MLASQIPVKVSTVWAANASGTYVHQVPIPSQQGVTPGAASFTDGFPPLTFVAGVAGGIPPFGIDENGILQQITAWNRWQAAGGPVTYDATWQGLVGGYPSGAMIMSLATFGRFWISSADNNTTNPDTGGAGWVDMRLIWQAYAIAGGSVNAWVVNPPITQPLVDGIVVGAQLMSSNTIAGPQVNVSSVGLKTIYLADNTTPVPIGWLPLNPILRWSASANASAGGWLCLNIVYPVSDTYGAVSMMQEYAGNPNGHVAGAQGSAGGLPPSTCWDTAENILWVCTTTGNAAGAVWTAAGGPSVKTYSGASKIYTLADRGVLYLRSNSGSAMTDTLPTSVPPNGWGMFVSNQGATALYSIAAPAGVNLQGTTAGTLTFSPDDTLAIYSDGTAYWAFSLPPTVGGTASAQFQTVGDANVNISSAAHVVEASVVFSTARTWTIPLAATVPAGKCITISDAVGAVTASNTLTLAPSGSDTVNGSASFITSRNFRTFDIVSDGISKWSTDSQATASAATQWVYINGGGTLTPGLYIADTTASAFSVTLESTPNLGDNYSFKDFGGNWGINHVTLIPSGGATINGFAENYILSTPFLTLTLTYKSGNWSVQ